MHFEELKIMTNDRKFVIDVIEKRLIERNVSYVKLNYEGYTELHFLEPTFKMKYLEEMSLVAEAVYNVYKPDKMNYELLGNGDSHIHWHLFPRYNGDLNEYGNNGKGPVWWLPKEEMWNSKFKPSTEELEILTNQLKVEIERLINKKR